MPYVVLPLVRVFPMSEKAVAQWIIDTVELFGGDRLTALRVAEAFITGVRRERERKGLPPLGDGEVG